MLNDKKIGYSHKQHRGNKDEGQFHVTHKNYFYHKEHYFIESLTYGSIEEMLKERRSN